MCSLENPLHVDLLTSLVVRLVGAVDPRQDIVGVRLELLSTHVPAVQLHFAATVLLDIQSILAVEGDIFGVADQSEDWQCYVAASVVVETQRLDICITCQESDRCTSKGDLTAGMYVLEVCDEAIVIERRLLLKLECRELRVGLGDWNAFAKRFDPGAFVTGAERCAVKFCVVGFEDEVEGL